MSESLVMVEMKNSEHKMLGEFIESVCALVDKVDTDVDHYSGKMIKKFLGVPYSVIFDPVELISLHPILGRYLSWMDGFDSSLFVVTVGHFDRLVEIHSLRKAGTPMSLGIAHARALNQWRKGMEEYNEQ